MSRGLPAAIWGQQGLRLVLGDAAIILALLAAAFASFAIPRRPAAAPIRATVSVGGREAAVLDLAHEGRTAVRGPLGETVVEVRGGRVRIAASPCPRHLCLRQGWADAGGAPLVCAPNGVVVRLEGPHPGRHDAVTR